MVDPRVSILSVAISQHCEGFRITVDEGARILADLDAFARRPLQAAQTVVIGELETVDAEITFTEFMRRGSARRIAT